MPIFPIIKKPNSNGLELSSAGNAYAFLVIVSAIDEQTASRSPVRLCSQGIAVVVPRRGDTS